MTEPVRLSRLDVVSIEKNRSPLNASTFKVSEAIVNLVNRMSREFAPEILREWAWDGVEAEVLLRDGREWQSGKVRVSLEFIPDPEEEEELDDEPVKSLPQSPLDDLRAELLEES